MIKKSPFFLLLAILILSIDNLSSQQIWNKIEKTNYTLQKKEVYQKKHFPSEYEILSLDVSNFSNTLKSKSANQTQIIELPNSDFGFNLNAGTRLNIHNEYGNNVVFNVNPSYNFKVGKNNFKVFASYSTAFVTPTLSEIFTKSSSVDDSPKTGYKKSTPFSDVFWTKLIGSLSASSLSVFALLSATPLTLLEAKSNPKASSLPSNGYTYFTGK